MDKAQGRPPAPDWYHALTLGERRADLRPAGEQPALDGPDAERAQRRLRRWREQPPFTGDGAFARRLAGEGLSEQEFLRLLGEPIEAVGGRCPAPPGWLTELDRTFSLPAPAEPFPPLDMLGGAEAAGSLRAVAPLVRRGCARLRAGIEALTRERGEVPFDPGSVESLLLPGLTGQLAGMLARTMALELNVARLEGRLQGATPEERYRSFFEQVGRRDVAAALAREYPVLFRQVALAVDQWVEFSLSFLGHLCADGPALRETFSPGEDPGPLVALDGGQGDKHQGGRSVLIAQFRSGLRVVYKPRSLAVDVHFQGLLAWLNARGAHPPFRTLAVLDRGSHGWVEYVRAEGCATPEEVRRFYERQGAYLALLYVLEATDFHYENLVAAGEHPVLIDLEGLFHPRLATPDPRRADGRALGAVGDSVLGVGLLPSRVWANGESPGVDLSGLGSPEGELTPAPVPTWEGTGTDEMRLARKRVPMTGGRNRPTLHGTAVNALDHADAILAGFAALYGLLERHRGELPAAGGPVARFAADEVRVIVRNTRGYAELLSESFHPDLLRSALERDRLLDRLWAGVDRSPHLARVLAAERHDLNNGDVPRFTTRPDSCDVWTSAGERLAGVLPGPGLERARRRLLRLGKEDRERQLWFIRASLATLATGPQAPQGTERGEGRPRGAGREELLAAARAVGDRLGELALCGEDDATWLGLALTRERHWSLSALGLDLYEGLPGVALFLARLGAVTCVGRYTELARRALTTLRRQVGQGGSALRSLGAFTGWGGVVYALSHLGALWGEPGLWDEAEAVAERVPGLIEGDEQLDVLGGSAGCIGGLLSLYCCRPSPRVRAAAVACGDQLLAQARPTAGGLGWVNPTAGPLPLTGFSHGAAGIGWALFELAAVTGAARFRAAAEGALAYERGLFCAEQGNWADLRGGAEGPVRCMVAWCHGAPGIGLARLRCLAHGDDPVTRAEVRIALETTLAAGVGPDPTLCHGALGNLELLLEAARTLGEPCWGSEARRLAGVVLGRIRRDGWVCATPLGVESPGLMTGLAGIGYGLLRLAAPERVPSVLALAPAGPARSG